MKIKKTFDKNILATLFLICFICVFFTIAAFRVNRLATESCFDTLDNTAIQVAADIRTHVESDLEQLSVVADLLAQHEEQDSETVRRHLSSFSHRGTIAALGLLLPDNRLVLGTGKGTILEDVFDYSAELSRLPYTSDIVEVPDDSGNKIYYYAVPVEKGNQTFGILYGFVNLSDFADSITVTAFDGNAQVFVADGNTGDFLVDTWHDHLGNIFDGDILKRKVKSGYDFHEMKMDFVEGKAGHIAFWSNTAGEYFYSYYMPVGVNQWMLQLAVLESIAFDDVVQIRRVLYFVAIMEIFSLAVYFLWVLSRVRRDTARKNQQLAQAIYMHDVQQTLFDAHKSPELFSAALQKVSEMLTAETSFFLTLENNNVKDIFYTSSCEIEQKMFFDKSAFDQHFLLILQELTLGKSLLLYPKDIPGMTDEQEREELARSQITNLMFVPVLNSSRELAGILGCVNMKKQWENCTLLECVSRNFLMAMSNMKFYRQIEYMSMVDALTGLRNRNCYESFLENTKGENAESFGCLYIDVNGLHELNNTMGHAAGDAMLICVGDSMKMYFRPQDCYRIGGDEFVAFYSDCSREEITQRIDHLNGRMDSFGYHISIGEAWLSESLDVKDMITTAEKRMYEAKRLYYQQTGRFSRA